MDMNIGTLVTTVKGATYSREPNVVVLGADEDASE